MANEIQYLFNPESTQQNNLMQSVLQDAQRLFGVNLMYLPMKDLVAGDVDEVWGEIKNNRYEKLYGMRMILEDANAMQGQDLFSKFGLQVQDEIILYTVRKEFYERLTGIVLKPFDGSNVDLNDVDMEAVKPRIEDLIYVPMWKSLFQITYVEEWENFLGGYKSHWKLICKKMALDIRADDIDLDTIDNDTAEVDAVSTDPFVAEINDIQTSQTQRIREKATTDIDQTGYVDDIEESIMNPKIEEAKADVKKTEDDGDVFSKW
jgi:hypothetical protein